MIGVEKNDNFNFELFFSSSYKTVNDDFKQLYENERKVEEGKYTTNNRIIFRETTSKYFSDKKQTSVFKKFKNIRMAKPLVNIRKSVDPKTMLQPVNVSELLDEFYSRHASFCHNRLVVDKNIFDDFVDQILVQTSDKFSLGSISETENNSERLIDDDSSPNRSSVTSTEQGNIEDCNLTSPKEELAVVNKSIIENFISKFLPEEHSPLKNTKNNNTNVSEKTLRKLYQFAKNPEDLNNRLKLMHQNSVEEASQQTEPNAESFQIQKRGIIDAEIDRTKHNKFSKQILNKYQFAKVSSPKRKFVPPKSPHNLIEEEYTKNPWALLVATIFLNKTTAKIAKPVIDSFLSDHPDPESVIAKAPEDLEHYFDNLGLKKRAKLIWNMSVDYVRNPWKEAKDLRGIGKYGNDAYRMFIKGDTTVKPSDRYLKKYLEWWLQDCDKT